MAARRVLYLSYNGIQEPLVVSQVLAYLERLSGPELSFHLLTFEKERPSPEVERELRTRLAQAGIRWTWLRYHHRPRLLATALDVARGVRAACRIARLEGVDLLHARSFVPGVIAREVQRQTGLPYLFDIRGFWVDEKVYKGSLRAGSAAHRVAKRLEASVYRHAAGVVSLTHAAAQVLRESRYWDRVGRQPPIAVIPTCTDLERFAAAQANRVPRSPDGALRLVYVGSLGPGYLPDEIAKYFRIARDRFPGATLHVITRSDHDAFRETLARHGVPAQAVRLSRADPSEIPALLAEADAALCFIEPHASKVASCPTKLGEYLAAGLPVVANAIGDVERILTEDRVTGVVLGDFTETSIVVSLDALAELVARNSSAHGLSTAREWFDLKGALESYRTVYVQVIC